MKRLLVISLPCLGVSSVAGCQSSILRKVAPINFVPSMTVVVVSVKWPEVRKDDYLKRVVKGDEIEAVFQKLNIPGDQVAEFVIFTDSSEPANESTGIILNGSYRMRTVIDHPKAQGWAEEFDEGYKLYFNAAENVWLAPLKSGLLVVGGKSSVEG